MLAAAVREDPATTPARSGWPPLLLLGAVVLLSRLPFVRGAGLGRDPDAWRVYLSGTTLRDGGYAPSRPPGYPLMELTAALFDGLPWAVFTTATALVTTVGVVALGDLLRGLGVRWWWVPPLGVAATPVVWVHSTTAMDYGWAFALLLVALAVLQRGHLVPAGVLFGAAVAYRPSTVLVAPFVLALLLAVPRHRAVRTWLRLALPAAAVVLTAMLLPLLTYGRDVVRAVPEEVPLRVAYERATDGVFGSLAVRVVLAVALLAVVVLAVRWRRLPADARGWALAGAVGGVAQGLTFLLLPADSGYLLPAVAMLWVLVGVALPGIVTAGLALVLLASSLLPVGPGGVVRDDAAIERAEMAAAQRLLDEIEALPAGTQVVCLFRLPQLVALAGIEVPADDDPVGAGAALELPSGVVLRYDDPASSGPAPYRVDLGPLRLLPPG